MRPDKNKSNSVLELYVDKLVFKTEASAPAASAALSSSVGVLELLTNACVSTSNGLVSPAGWMGFLKHP